MSKTYVYKAKTAAGQILNGQIIADSPSAVASFIREKGHYVLQIQEEKRKKNLTDFLSYFSTVKTKELAIFCRLFSTMSGAGISFVNCLSILQEQTENPKLRQALGDVYKRIREGESLAQAMGNHPSVFPPIMVGMIDAGETGGVLDKVLNRLAILFEKEYKMQEKIKSAMTYPMVVMFMAVVAVIFIVTFVLPKFTPMLLAAKIEIPLPTRILLNISHFMQENWPLFVILMTGIIGVLSLAYKRPAIRYKIDQMVYFLPVFGGLMKKVSIARFANTLGILLKSGVPVITAFDMVKKIINNSKMLRVLTEAQLSVRSGATIAVPLQNSQIFSPMVVQMIRIGEESGELDDMLEKISDFYELEVDETVARLSSLIEPFLIAFLGIVIGSIVLAVLLPMIETVTHVGG